MKTYTVSIDSTEHYIMNVTAPDKNAAEAEAWRLFPHHTPDYITNDVLEVICQDEENE